jgi:hypothetical protein
VARPELPSPERLVFVLTDDLEADDFPLWEFVWTLNTMAPSVALVDKVGLARRAVSMLADEYELWRVEWPGGPTAPLSDHEIRLLAADDAAWHDPENAALLVWL